MKSLKDGSANSFVSYLIQCLALSSAIQMCAMAQEEKVVNVNNDQQPVNVDGEALEEEVVDGELQYLENELKKQDKQIKLNSKKTQKYKKLQNTTEKLSNTTEKYVEEKKASEKSIKEYNQKIKCLLDESGTDPDCDAIREEQEADKKIVAPAVIKEEQIQDQTPVQQAAPQQPVIIQNILPEPKTTEKAPVESPEVIPLSIENTIEKDVDMKPVVQVEAYEKLKLYPYIGMSSYNGTGVDGLQSNALLGIRFESKPYAGRLAMGAGLTYRQLTARDGGLLYYNPFGLAPEFELTNTTVDIYGKLILIKESSFMPYILGGIGYNNMSVSYRENDPFSGAPTGNAQRNFITGSVGGGIDYAFSQSVGANLELNYTRNISSLNNEGLSNQQSLWGQSNLNNLANNFTEANVFSVQAGLIVFF
jgi:hypothetical protein